MAGLTKAQLAEKKRIAAEGLKGSSEESSKFALGEEEKEDGELTLGLHDGSQLTYDDRIRTLVQLLMRLPAQYVETEAMLKQNIWNLTRFEPTNAMIAEARGIIENDPKRA